jgi:hypothetical protein
MEQVEKADREVTPHQRRNRTMKAIREELGQSEDLGLCKSHLERQNVRIPAVKVILGMPMCSKCWTRLLLGNEPEQRENNASL